MWTAARLVLTHHALGPLRSGHAARPWLAWLAPVALFLTLRALRAAAEALLWLLPPLWGAPSPVGLFALFLPLNALATVPLFRWPGPLPAPILAAATVQAVAYLQYLSAVNVAVLGRALGLWVGVPNVPVILWIAGEAAAALSVLAARPEYRLRLHRHFAYTLPLATLPQVALVGAAALLWWWF
jgi:hypothetical protein